MANGKADGTVYINTELDTSGIADGMKSIGKKDINVAGKNIGEEFTKGFDDGIASLDNSGSGIKSRLSALSGTLTKVGGTMSLAVTAPLTALGGKMVSSASDLEENINKVEVAFGNSAEKVKSWAETATESFGLSKNQALEATSLFGDMATSMGLSQENASDMSTTLAGLAGDLASFKNIDVEQAMTALNGVFTGETESLKTLGVVMTETNLEEFADSAGLVYKEMSQAEKVQLRYNYVLDKTKNAQGDYSRTADGAANSMRTLSASMENLVAELGQNLLPIITPIIQGITNIAKKFGEMSPFTQKLVIGIGLLVASIGPLLTSIGGIMTAVTTIGPMLGTIGAGLGAVAGPIAAVVAVIGVLVAAFKTLWENNEGFRESIISSWERIKEAVSSFSEGILERINSFGFEFGSLTEALSAAWNAFCEILAPIFESTFDVIATVLETVFSVLLQLFDVFRNIFEGNWEAAWEGIKSIFKTVWEGLTKVGESVLNSLLQILITVAEKIRTKFLAVFEKLKTGFKDIWNGIVDFIKGIINKIIGNINSLISGVVAGINAMIEAINGFGFEIPEGIPVIGGKSFSMNIPKITAPQIPYLASGAVIPPNAPFLAMLGDQRNGTNIEAPLSTIEEALTNVLNRRGDGDIVVQIDGREVFRAVRRQNKDFKTRTGSSAFA